MTSSQDRKYVAHRVAIMEMLQLRNVTNMDLKLGMRQHLMPCHIVGFVEYPTSNIHRRLRR